MADINFDAFARIRTGTAAFPRTKCGASDQYSVGCYPSGVFFSFWRLPDLHLLCFKPAAGVVGLSEGGRCF